MTPKIRKNSKNAATPAAPTTPPAAPDMTAPGSLGTSPADALATVNALVTDVSPAATSDRLAFGGAHDVLPTARASILPFAFLSHLFAVAVASLPKSNRCGAFFARVIPNVTRDDIPAMLDTAAMLLASAGVPGIVNPPANPPPASAIDPLVSFYYANNGKHLTSQNVSDLDRLAFPCRAVEMILSNVDRLSNRNTRRAYNGGYNGSDPTANRAADLASHVNALRNPPAAS